eukprot:scaffold2.g7233.t1
MEQQQPAPALAEGGAVGDLQAPQPAADAAAAGAVAEEQAGQGSPKRQRLAPWRSYEPADLVDLRLLSADGKLIEARTGGGCVHRAVLLRHSTLVRRLLEDCQDAQQAIPITEDAADLAAHFLDILYDPDVGISPSSALRVLALADKYDSPAVLRACGRVLGDPGFQLSTLEEGAPPGGCGLLQALALASKHGFAGLLGKALAFAEAQVRKAPAALRAALEAGRAQLEGLTPEQLAALALRLAGGAESGAAAAAANAASAALASVAAQAELTAAKCTLVAKEKAYQKLLAKHNRMLARAQAMGLQLV